MRDLLSTPPVLKLRLHGSAQVQVQLPGTQALPLRGRAAALVALAVLAPGTSRERAAQLLWPEAPRPRSNLRQQLLRFRQALGVDLLQGTDSLRLAAGVQPEPAAPGELLLTDETADESEWGQWLQRQRQAAQQTQVNPVLQALAQAEADHDADAALRHAKELLVLAPEDELHHLALMRVHYLRGEPAAGLAVYQALATRQAAQLGSRLSDSTEELANMLRRSAGLPAAPNASGLAPALAPTSAPAPALAPAAAGLPWRARLPLALRG